MTEKDRGGSSRILVVEDDPAIRELLCLHLSVVGHEVDQVATGIVGLERARAEAFDAIILDLMLPDIDGVTVCRTLRAAGASANAPLLMLTARDTEPDKVLGLESGADDYLTKPFGVRELLARVGALLRRQRRSLDQTPAEAVGADIRCKDLQLDLDRRVARVRGAEVALTRQEFDLLAQLASQPGIVFSRADVRAHVWSGDPYVTERTVDTVIKRLRRKIEIDPRDPELILTAWGVGYKCAD